MKVRFDFTSGIVSREVKTSSTMEDLLVAEFGNRMNFENLGGKAVVLEEEVAPEAPPVAKPKTKVK